MKRSTQEILELAVFALIALVLGTLLVWGVGWVFTGIGWLLRLVAGLIWSLLRFIIPIAIVAGVVYLVVRLLSQPRRHETASSAPTATTVPVPTAPSPSAPAAAPAAVVDEPAPAGPEEDALSEDDTVDLEDEPEAGAGDGDEPRQS